MEDDRRLKYLHPAYDNVVSSRDIYNIKAMIVLCPFASVLMFLRNSSSPSSQQSFWQAIGTTLAVREHILR